ncbi:MAG TPA: hypothetical protein VNI55_08455 [Gaiellaceae bacterium]|nr:hypothetical protein [Gaiellaceae bacterium]
MKRRIGTVLLGVLVGGLALLPGVRGSEAATGPATIRITDSQLSVARMDIAPRGTSPGDVEVVRQKLFNRRVTTTALGRAQLICTFVDDRRERVCQGTYFLPRGTIVVGGSLQYRQLYELAILGGTGLYDNARGMLTVTRTGRTPVRNLVIFRLAG